MKTLKMWKSSAIEVSGKLIESGIVFKLSNWLNSVDKKYFGKTHGLTICVIAKKAAKCVP
jgi:hypothetical protein